MPEDIKTMLEKKYEDRGWNQGERIDITEGSEHKIMPLGISLEKYQTFSLILSELALLDKSPDLCALYFELQRRATYGNHYPILEDMSEVERKMWDIGMQGNDNIERKRL